MANSDGAPNEDFFSRLSTLEAQQEAEKKAAGRYTLEDAAQAIADATGERLDGLLANLMASRRAGVLPTYAPGKNARYTSKTVRDFYEECFWDDLNKWLDANEQRISWRFPKPEHACNQAPAAPPVSTSALPNVESERVHLKPSKSPERGVTKAEILAAEWPLPSDAPKLENILREIPKWVEAACTRIGQRGKGASGSHLWNPALLAVCLATRTIHKRWIANRQALDHVIRESYSDYLDQWQDAKDRL